MSTRLAAYVKLHFANVAWVKVLEPACNAPHAFYHVREILSEAQSDCNFSSMFTAADETLI